MVRVEPERIGSLYESGKSAAKIAREIGCGEKTIYRALDSLGIARRPGGGRVVLRSAEIAEAYRSGEPLASIAKRFDCSVWAVQSASKRHGVERRRRGGQWKSLPEQTLDEIEFRYRGGESQQKLADAYGLHQTVVSRILRARGVETGAVRGKRNPRWKGGRYVGRDGYVLVRSDEFPEMVLSNGYVREHRLVMARHLGRALLPNETVHHKDGERAHNRIENLELFVGGHPAGASAPHCATCACFGAA